MCLRARAPMRASVSSGESPAVIIVREPQLDRESGELAHLVVRAEEQDVDPDDHLRDRLVLDDRERSLAEVAKRQVRRVAEIQHLEVVVGHLVHVLEETAVRGEKVVATHQASPLGHDPLVLDLGEIA